jgi:hypothetical protein
MKTNYLSSSIKAAVLVTALSCGANVRAVTTPASQLSDGVGPGQGQFQTVDEIEGFRDRPEAKMLAHAYAILATGDHDYAGHRVAAMNHVQRAGGFLGVDLAGDLKDHTKQVLSDDKLREAQRLINELILKDNIKSQKHVFNQLTYASKEIDLALATK